MRIPSEVVSVWLDFSITWACPKEKIALEDNYRWIYEAPQTRLSSLFVCKNSSLKDNHKLAGSDLI